MNALALLARWSQIATSQMHSWAVWYISVAAWELHIKLVQQIYLYHLEEREQVHGPGSIRAELLDEVWARYSAGFFKPWAAENNHSIDSFAFIWSKSTPPCCRYNRTLRMFLEISNVFTFFRQVLDMAADGPFQITSHSYSFAAQSFSYLEKMFWRRTTLWGPC